MPVYEYRCDNGHNFDVLQRMSDEAVTECTVCGAPVQRVFHPIAVHFKGSGFYNTDYGKQKRGNSNSSADEGGKSSDNGGPSKAPEKSGEKKTEKPASSTASSSPDS